MLKVILSLLNSSSYSIAKICNLVGIHNLNSFYTKFKEQYQAGGLGDVKIKRYLNEVLEAELEPIRKRREEYAANLDYVDQVLKEGSARANEVANQTLKEVRDAIGINYFG